MSKKHDLGDAYEYDKPIVVHVGNWPFWKRLEMAWRAFRKPDAYRVAPVIACVILDGAVKANVVMTHEDESKRHMDYTLSYKLLSDETVEGGGGG